MAGHWYKPDGSPFYTIKRSDGKGIRDVTLRDARKHNAVPSVSGIIQQLSKGNLERWKMMQLLDYVAEYGSLTNLINEHTNWKEQLIARSEQVNNKYSKRGTEIHDHLETYFKTGQLAEPDILDAVVDKVHDLTVDLDVNCEFDAEPSFCHVDGYGGKIDLVLKGAKGTIIIDFKTKSSDTLSKTNIYNDYLMQLAAYANNYDNVLYCVNILISVTKPGVIYLHKWDKKELEKGLKMFYNLLNFWQLNNNYYPKLGV